MYGSVFYITLLMHQSAFNSYNKHTRYIIFMKKASLFWLSFGGLSPQLVVVQYIRAGVCGGGDTFISSPCVKKKEREREGLGLPVFLSREDLQ
jgi:hypothetical protein